MRPQRAQGKGEAVDALLHESFTVVFVCMDMGASSRKTDFINASISFYSSIMNLYSLSNVSLRVGTSPHCKVKTKSQFFKSLS